MPDGLSRKPAAQTLEKQMREPLLKIRLDADYRGKPGALHDVVLEIASGEILGLVGESGCGKSTLSLALLGLLSLKGGKTRGEIQFDGRNLVSLHERDLQRLRGKDLALVLQSPMSSLNPALRIGTQLGEAWKVHNPGTREHCRLAMNDALANASLPQDETFLRRYPSQISVGQAQRVLIAMAILHRPALLIADEPTSALDLITQSEILHLFADLNRKLGMSILYISHDLLSVATISHRIAVMEKGTIVECAHAGEIFRNPQHPYTRQLISALPVLPRALSATVGK